MKLFATSITLFLGIMVLVFSSIALAVTTQHHTNVHRNLSSQQKPVNTFSHVKHTNKEFKNRDEICVSCGGAGF